MIDQERDPKRIEALAKAVWEYYYPNGGSIFPTYESLQEKDKDIHRREARAISDFLDGAADVIPR